MRPPRKLHKNKFQAAGKLRPPQPTWPEIYSNILVHITTHPEAKIPQKQKETKYLDGEKPKKNK